MDLRLFIASLSPFLIPLVISLTHFSAIVEQWGVTQRKVASTRASSSHQFPASRTSADEYKLS